MNTVTLNSTNTQYGRNTSAWALRFGTKNAVTFDIITIRRDQVRKNDLVERYGMLCIITGVSTAASGWRGAAPETRVYVSGNDWDSGTVDEMVTVYRKAEKADTVDPTAARQAASIAYRLNPTDANLSAYQDASDAEMDAVLARFDARHAADTYTTGQNRENLADTYGS